MTTTVCEKCKQIAFDETRKEFDGKMLCPECYDFIVNKQLSWDNENLAIKMYLGEEDCEHVFVPLIDNLTEAGYYDDEDLLESFSELKRKWEEEKWGFYHNAWDVEIVNIKEYHNDISLETIRDDEFWDLHIYKDLAYTPEFYARPFDENPQDLYFVNWFAADCYEGRVYSKDFGYYHCEDCQRTVCGQNPSNGWMSQVHIHDGWVECNKCYEERVLSNGINEDFNDDIPGQFFCEGDILDAGWEPLKGWQSVLAGSGRRGHADPRGVIDKIEELVNKDVPVLVNYEDMAIGGMGGYVSLYTKSK